MFGNLLKAAVGIITLPVDIVADVFAMTDINKEIGSHTADKCGKILDNIDKAVSSD